MEWRNSDKIVVEFYFYSTGVSGGRLPIMCLSEAIRKVSRPTDRHHAGERDLNLLSDCADQYKLLMIRSAGCTCGRGEQVCANEVACSSN